MTTSEISDKIHDILSEQLGLNKPEIDPDKTWEDHTADSLDEVEIVMAIEKEFSLQIEDEDAERLAKMPINEGVLWIEAQLSQ